ncbi:MAG: NifB/NifX family molybdenum-iron cluster-binding protein [Melioribacteraceae bacterium]|nr:NifB/NifX family molybdenum-iron cluster-binding protein [Melioribacteraceae bacterium]
MIIALAVEKNSIDSYLFSVFGRCKYILLYNSGDNSRRIIPNPFSAAFDGAGIQASQLLIENNCDVLIANNIGNHALAFLNSVGVKVYKSGVVTASTAIALFDEGKLEEAESKNADKRERVRYRKRGSQRK